MKAHEMSEATAFRIKFTWAIFWRVSLAVGALVVLFTVGDMLMQLRKDKDQLLYRTWLKVYKYDMTYAEWYRLREGDDLPKVPKS